MGSYNDTHFLKLDITYDVTYEAYCIPSDGRPCKCVNKFPEFTPSRYMLQPSPFALNLVYIGDIHQPTATQPPACGRVNVGSDFFKMMAFFYAINRYRALHQQTLAPGNVTWLLHRHYKNAQHKVSAKHKSSFE